MINGNSLQRVGDGRIETTTTFLGIYLHEFFTWKPHIKHVKNIQNCICHKASETCSTKRNTTNSLLFFNSSTYFVLYYGMW
jgi:hypothetical protein